MEGKDLDDETFGEASTGQAGLRDANDSSAAMMRMMMGGGGSDAAGLDDSLPDFFKTMGTSGDQEFSSLMKDLADAGADSAAGGLDDLYGSITGETNNNINGINGDGLADFFQTGGNGTGGALGKPTEASSAGGGGGGGNDSGGLDSPTGLYDQLASFGLGAGEGDAGGKGGGDNGAALLASLGLPVMAGEAGQGASGAAFGGVGSGGSGADQSEWALMQKQFEDMNRSFLQDYRHIEEDGHPGTLDTANDDGEQAAFATMRQLSLDDAEPGFPSEALPATPTRTSPSPYSQQPVPQPVPQQGQQQRSPPPTPALPAAPPASAIPAMTGRNVLPPGVKTLEELEAEFAEVSIAAAGDSATVSSPPGGGGGSGDGGERPAMASCASLEGEDSGNGDAPAAAAAGVRTVGSPLGAVGVRSEGPVASGERGAEGLQQQQR
ncbi:unnamed protein product, partial [Scytosiphon promiscuus]